MAKPRNRWIQIEGFGDALSNRQYRLCESAVLPSEDPNGVYLPVVQRGSFAPEDARIDYRAEGAQRASIGGLNVRAIASPTMLALLKSGRPLSFGEVTVAVDDDDLFLTIDQGSDTTDYSNQMALWSREGIYIYSRSGSGPYTYAALRGQLGTTAKAHTLDADQDISVFLASELGRHSLQARTILYGYTPQGGSYADEVIVKRLVLTNIFLSQDGGSSNTTRIEIVADSALAAVMKRKLCEGAWKGQWTRSIPPETDPYFQVNYSGPGLPSSNPFLASIGDATALTLNRLGTPETGQAQITYPEAFDTTLTGSQVYSYEEHGEEEEIHEMFSSAPSAPDLQATGTATRDRLSTNGPHLIRQMLTSSDTGDNGDWDLGTGKMGVALPEAFIDDASFDAAALATSSLVFDAEHFGQGGARPTVGERAGRISAACNMVLIDGADGRLRLSPMKFVPTGGEHHIYQADILSITRQEPRDEDAAAQIVVKYADRVGPGPIEQTFDDPAVAQRSFGQAASMSLDLSGISDLDTVEARALQELLLYRGQLLEVDCELLLTPEIEALAPGDDLVATSTELLGRDGAFGVVEGLYKFLSMGPDTTNGRVPVTLLYTGSAPLRAGLIGPSALVDSVNVAGDEITIVANAFSAQTLPGQTDDTFGFSDGVQVSVYSRDGSTQRGLAKVNTITGLVFTLLSPISGIVAGDVVKLSPLSTSAESDYVALERDFDWV